jgi:hypothetical protein
MTPRVAALLVTIFLTAGCVTAPSPPAGSARVELYQPLGRDFFVRQNVVARFGEDERHFEIALQSRCGELRLVGLSSFGVRLFSAVRSPEGLVVESITGQPLPFDPARILRDVERSFFRSSPPQEGREQIVVFAGERVSEWWRDGRLETRRIQIGDDPSDPPLEIRYGGRVGAAGISQRLDLSNPLFGYALEIHNHQIEELRCVSDDS